MGGSVEIRLTGTRADVEALADALTRHGERLGLVVVEACVGRVYLHTHPATLP